MVLSRPDHAAKGTFLVLLGLFISAGGSAFHQEKEKLYVELKHILARQPGPEAAEQLQIYRQTLREKSKQLKVSSLCPFPAKAWAARLSKAAASARGAGLPNAYSTKVGLYSTVLPAGRGKPQSYPSAPGLRGPTILHFLKQRSNQVRKELGRG